MVLASGRIGRTILSVPAPLPLPELPEDVIQVIFERSSSFQVSKVSREWNGIHRKRMQKAKKWVMWVLRYMTCVSYFVNATFILLGKDGVKIEILINSMLNYPSNLILARKSQGKRPLRIGSRTLPRISTFRFPSTI